MKADQIIKKYKLDEKTWVRKGFEGVLQYFFVVGEMVIKPVFDYYGDGYNFTIVFFNKNECNWYWHKEDMTRMRKSFIKHVHRDEKYLDKLVKEWHRRVKLFKKIMNEVEKTDLDALSNQDLYKLYLRWHEAYRYEFGIAIAWQDPFSMNAEDFLYPHLKSVIDQAGYSEKVHEYSELLVAPVTESFLSVELQERLKLRVKIIQFPDKRIRKHAERWHWIMNNYSKSRHLDENYFAHELQRISAGEAEAQLENMERQFKETVAKKQALMAKLNLDQETKNLIRISEVFAYMQDERKKYMLMAVDQQDQFTDEIAKRFKLTKQQAQYSFIYEIPRLMKGEVKKSILDERFENTCLIQTLDGYKIYQGAVAEEVFKLVFAPDVTDVQHLEGLIASSGKATGRVKVVRKITDIADMKKGDILVASMTRPDMVQAMKLAGAIVTDEGGVTSHAAIVSRELKIPCIIGTKHATQVFKDGDMVEVDADSGVVKKI